MKVLTRKATMLSAVAFMLSTGAVASFSPSTRLPNRGGAFLERKTAPSRPSAPATKSSLFMAGQAAASKAPLVQKLVNSLVAVPVFFFRQFQTMTRSQKLTAFCFLAAGFLLGRTKPFWTRYTAVIDIPSSYFGPDAPVLTGRAVRVSDGDTIRFLHTPTPFHSKELQKGEKSSKVALPIRICTIDTPETAKFGKPGQPFGVEAKETLKSLLEDKNVKIRLLQADQYGRGVAQVFTGNFANRKFADQAMLEAGMAEVYQGGGAVYGPLGLDAYLGMQEEAKQQKMGIWSLGKRESAAEYKRRTKS